MKIVLLLSSESSKFLENLRTSFIIIKIYISIFIQHI